MAQQTDIALGVGARSETGRRDDNQDKMTAFSTPLGTFYIVADGMGGHRGGAEASRSVVEGYRNHLLSFPDAADISGVLQHATSLTNSEILAAGRSGDPSTAGMGSTVVMAMLRSDPSGMEVLTAHIGDSRAYLLRGGVLTQLTHDHSAVQRLVDEQLITQESARSHPDLNVLTRALGKQADVVLEIGQRLPLYMGDTVLLCTDGLWGHVTDEQIAYELSADRTTSETADTLVQLALDQGSDDNITLQILRLEDRQSAGRPFVPEDTSATIPRESQRRSTAPSDTIVPGLPPAASPPVSSSSPKKKPVLLYALLVMSCILLAAGGTYFAKRFQKTVTTQRKTDPPECYPHGSLVSVCVDGKLPDKNRPAPPQQNTTPAPPPAKTPAAEQKAAQPKPNPARK